MHSSDFLEQSSTLETYFSKMAKFWKKKVLHYWKKTSGKQVFQSQKKVTMLGFPKPTFTAYFLATFDCGKNN